MHSSLLWFKLIHQQHYEREFEQQHCSRPDRELRKITVSDFSSALRLIIQDFPFFTTSQEQQDSIVSCCFFFIPLESVTSLKPPFDYNWNAHIVWSLTLSTKAEKKKKTGQT